MEAIILMEVAEGTTSLKLIKDGPTYDVKLGKAVIKSYHYLSEAIDYFNLMEKKVFA